MNRITRKRRSVLCLFHIVIVGALLLTFFGGQAQTARAATICFTLRDKDIHTVSGIVNTYFPGSSTAAAGATQISLGAGRGANANVASGDLLLVIQMQDALINSSNSSAYGNGGTSGSGYTNPNNAGKYEFVVAASSLNYSTGGSLTIRGKGSGDGLLNTYTYAIDSSSSGQRRFQVIRVPAYLYTTLSGTVTSPAWDGSTGGVVVLDTVNTLDFNGYHISADSLGFRGGGGRALTGGFGLSNTDYVRASTVNAHASKGESIAGTPRYVFYNNATLDTAPSGGTDGYPNGSYARGAPGNAGGGGTDGHPSANDENSGGGGGGNGGVGGLGGNSWSSNLATGGHRGANFAERSAGRVVLGGGGGAGTTNNGSGTPANGQASSGATGGGIVIIRTGQISSSAISASGANALDVGQDGGGGGGAGGSVVVLTQGTTLSGLTVSVQGGNGGNTWPNQPPGTNGINRHGPGGGGGGGVVYLSSAGATINLNGGLNGTSTTSLDAYGATPGASGVSATNITASDIPGAEPGFLCFTPTAVSLTSLNAISSHGQLANLLEIFVVFGIFIALFMVNQRRKA